MLDELDICPVFTAHPTEAKRVTVRRIIARMRDNLGEVDRKDLVRRERNEVLTRIRSDLMCFWETETIRPAKPSVLDEVARNLYIAGTLWEVVPRLYRDLRTALQRNFGAQPFRIPRFVSFGTWIGGDRDGNPYVTASVTQQTIDLLRHDVLKRHLESCKDLEKQISLSNRYHTGGTQISSAVEEARRRWSDVGASVDRCHPRESYRQWMRVIRKRLEATEHGGRDWASDSLSYHTHLELAADVELVAKNLRESGHTTLADGPVQEWLDRICALGFHTAELDIREESARLLSAVQELAAQMGVCSDISALSEEEKQAFLLTEPTAEAVHRLNNAELSAPARETLDLFRLIARTTMRYGPHPLGALIVSMTHHPSDVLAMLWLGRVGAYGVGVLHTPLPIMPLLETIDDLQRADGILRALLGHPEYRAHVAATGGHQICMIGYSDSVKDGGYLAANWQLYDSQSRLAKLSEELGIPITFFHGRGGALGRGGGPAARAVLALPPDSVHGKLRVTEQGEVVAERYGDPRIAHRHLEQLTWATMLVSADGESRPSPAWAKQLAGAAQLGLQAYKKLVDDPAFPTYFQSATPIEVIESLPIGSRPSRRGSRSSLTHLRAIPYTFAWTQSRHMVTGYYGLGSGLNGSISGDGLSLVSMYKTWPFFRALIDNAELALAKTEPEIMRQYATMMVDHDDAERIVGQIEAEFFRTREAILRIKQRHELLETTQWLLRAVALRNPHVDILNFIQVELLRRRRADASAKMTDDEPLAEALRSTVHAVSAGVRTTG
jgi:phosphoenolpyruvate carboxylase